MALRPYAEYDKAADAEAYAKHKKWKPILAVVLGAVGGVAGVALSPRSQAPGAAAGLVAGAVVGYLVYRLILYTSSKSAADARYTADWCAHHGMTLLGDDASPANGPYADSGVRQRSYRAVEGPLGGVHTLAYNFSYWTRSTDSKGNTTETEHPYKIMRLTGIDLPIARLTIHERGFMNRFEVFDKLQGKLTAERPIKLESVEFNEKYDLTISDDADDIWIRRIFDPATIAASTSGQIHIPDLKYYDKAWWFIESGHLDAKHLEKLVEWNAKVVPAVQHLARVPNL